MSIPDPEDFMIELFGRSRKTRYEIDPDKITTLEDMKKVLPVVVKEYNKLFEVSEVEGIEHVCNEVQSDSVAPLSNLIRARQTEITQRPRPYVYDSIGVF